MKQEKINNLYHVSHLCYNFLSFQQEFHPQMVGKQHIENELKNKNRLIKYNKSINIIFVKQYIS